MRITAEEKRAGLDYNENGERKKQNSEDDENNGLYVRNFFSYSLGKKYVKAHFTKHDYKNCQTEEQPVNKNFGLRIV